MAAPRAARTPARSFIGEVASRSRSSLVAGRRRLVVWPHGLSRPSLPYRWRPLLRPARPGAAPARSRPRPWPPRAARRRRAPSGGAPAAAGPALSAISAVPTSARSGSSGHRSGPSSPRRSRCPDGDGEGEGPVFGNLRCAGGALPRDRWPGAPGTLSPGICAHSFLELVSNTFHLISPWFESSPLPPRCIILF